MNAKERAEDLVNQFRMVLMNEDTECGNEILCTSIAIENALITINEMIEFVKTTDYTHGMMNYLLDVRCELNTLMLGE
jgi:hypothetical protein